MPREGVKEPGVGTSKGTPFYAKKSAPNPSVIPPAKDSRDSSKKYSTYLAFVDDPKSRSPFTVLHASKILNYKEKSTIDHNYLSNSRRKRKYDIAFTSIFKFTCRIFAKCESFVKITDLHEIIRGLNDSYNALLTCKVDVESAYETLIDNNARKVKVGVEYDTGRVLNKRARLGKPPDTASSLSEKSNHSDDPEDDKNSNHSDNNQDNCRDSQEGKESDTEHLVPSQVIMNNEVEEGREKVRLCIYLTE